MRGATDENHSEGTSILARIRKAAAVPGRELEQAIVRALIVACVSVYLLVSLQIEIVPLARASAGLVLLGALALLALAILAPQASLPRRLLTMGYDVAAITWGMYLAGPAGAPLYPLYLWVAFGNGLRFGFPYLYVGSALGLIGFSAVIMASPFWRTQTALSAGLLLGLVLLPIYVASLLKRAHHTAERRERTTREKNRLLDNLTQAMRAPVSGIMGMSDLLRETELSREQREFTDAINLSANSLASMVGNVYDNSRIEDGTLPVTQRDFDLHNVLNGAMGTLRAQARAKNSRIELRIDPRIPFQLRGDPQHLRQTLSNLTIYGLETTRHGRVDVAVLLAHADPEHVVVRFEISSTGAANMPQKASHVPGRSLHEDDTLLLGDVTTRLGVRVAKGLIGLMDGQFACNESTQGVDIRFELPLARQKVAAGTPGRLDNARVLLIADQHSPNTGPIRAWLHDWQAQLDTVESASSAFVRAESALKRGSPYHAVIIDKPLIDIDAPQFALAMRKSTAASNTSLILVTGPTDRSQHAMLQDAGYTCLLASPVDKRLLFNALHSAPILERFFGSQIVPLRTHLASPRAAGNRTRILVAEDNPTSQRFISRVLERAGHTVDLVQNGEEALDALEIGQFDLVILDMHMPVMDGVQTAKLYRFIHPDRIHIPFVMLTANASPEAKLECEAAGIDTFLTKPIQPARLLEIVDRLLHRRHPAHFIKSSKHDTPRQHERTSGTMEAEGPPVLNLTSLQEVENLGHGSDFFHDLIQGFIRDGNRLLEKLEDALKRDDHADFRDASQALKGNAGSIGAVRLYKSCLQVERMSRADYELLGGQVLADVRAEFRRACAALIEYSKKISNNAGN